MNTGRDQQTERNAVPKLGMRDTRQQQFIDAAITIIGAGGLRTASNARIAAQAGLSASLLPHYFPDRSMLLTAILRHLLRDRHLPLLDRLAACDTAFDRLHARIDAYFAPDLYTPEMRRLWIDLQHAASEHQMMQRVHFAFEARLQSTVRADLRPLLSQRTLDQAAIGFTALMSGLRLKILHTADSLDAEQAATLQRQYLTMITTRIRISAAERLA
ncbi:MAG: TetR family transcriptional regulator C-terminal domain-containing protein [Alphaproteobacteria bacterium]